MTQPFTTIDEADLADVSGGAKPAAAAGGDAKASALSAPLPPTPKAKGQSGSASSHLGVIPPTSL